MGTTSKTVWLKNVSAQTIRVVGSVTSHGYGTRKEDPFEVELQPGGTIKDLNDDVGRYDSSKSGEQEYSLGFTVQITSVDAGV